MSSSPPPPADSTSVPAPTSSSSPPPAADSASAPAPTSSTGKTSKSELLSPPPVRSAEFIPDKAEYENEEEELVNLGAFQFNGSSCREKSQFLTLQKFLFSDRIKKMLGEGTYGKVALVASETRRLFAAKFFVKGNNEAEDNDEAIGVEERVYKHLGSSVHDSVAKIIGIGYVDWAPDGCNKKIMLMPLLGISIGDMVEQAQQMDSENRALLKENEIIPKVSFRIKKIQEIGRNILLGLKFLLDHNVFHLDLKPDNVLFSAQSTFKVILKGGMHSIVVPRDTKVQITDMGLAKVVSDLSGNSEIYQSPMYRAPEIFSGGIPNNKTDLWSFSIMLLQLYTCEDEYWPIGADHAHVQYFRNLQHALGQQMTPELWEEVSKIKGGKKVRGALKLYDNGQADPNTPPLMSLKRSYHADRLFDFLKYSLVVDWNVRPTVEDLLNHPFFQKK
ncbi:hypothetical protein CRE_13808 [Caenorhabditis remanei]|uniref:Protein kinase domain-containing protein n=1 Tax=Caenorhabditis remanei TaxID=31234 RepID=E3NMU3_CAERE|nr:hypothetical protein CRE_13808 [Caenorhabditis remanei]